MLKSYILVALRSLKRHKLFSFINILCLSLGITFSLLIGVYIVKEKTVNAGLKNAGNQYLIKSKWKEKNMGLEITTVGPLARTMKEDYPGLVANYYRYNPVTNVVSAGDNHFKEDIAIGDTSFVSMYGFPVLYGNKEQPFADNNSAVITESMAVKLYGTANAVGRRLSVQTLLNNEKQQYLVSAVLKDIPYNSVTGLIGDHYHIFVPTEGSRYYQGGDPAVSWNSIYEVAFIELKKGVSVADMQVPFQQTLAKYAPGSIRNNLEVELAAVKDYYTAANNGAVQKMILVLALIGGFILLMALINFVNISIGTSSYRLKEVGLRKVLGGKRRQLVGQFLSESILLALVAGVISLVAYVLLRPVFGQLLSTTVPHITEFGFSGIGFFVAFILLTGIVAGLYPAVVLSASRIAFSVKGKIAAGPAAMLRRSLLVVQFTLTIIVFIGALHVSKQVAHIFNKDLGYNKEQLLVITAFPKQWDTAGVRKMERIRQQLLEVPVVKSATLAFEVPDRKPPGTLPLLPADGKSSQPLNILTVAADEDYAATYEMEMASGNFFNHNQPGYIPGQIVLNEAAAKALGLDVHTAPGRQLYFPQGGGGPLTVAGVVKDYNYSAIEEGIEPLAFMHVNDYLSYRFLTLRVKAGDIGGSIAAIRNKWKEASPASPFEYFFMDEKFASLYRSELQLKKAATVATVMNLLIVLMGVFGVVAFTLTRRNKEIAIRKVLGANARSVIQLFLKEYGWTILVANSIAWPAAYWVVDSWLQHYPYRIQQDILSYLLVGAAVFFIAFLLVTVQCFKTASASPATNLRTE